MATKSFVNIRYKTAKKTGVFCQIFPDIVDLFSQPFHYMKALYVQMMDLYFFFKQKTAYEISACLVGSEMCIRDSESALHADDGAVIYFPICQGTLLWQPNHL